MMKSIISAAGLVAAVTAFTQPTAQTYGALITPNTDSPVTTGQTYSVTWTPKQPADGVTVSLVLCNGPGANCVLQGAAIAEQVPASLGSYSWSVPCSLPEGVASTATGYGMLIIVDGTGEFQYSTQFSVQKGASCSSSSSSSSSSSTTSSGPTSSSSASSTISGGPVSSPTSSGWYSWTSTFNTTTTPAYTATSKYTPSALTTTSKPSASSVYIPSSSAVAATTAATPKPFTGAAAVPSAFVNAAGLIGAAGLAMLAL